MAKNYRIDMTNGSLLPKLLKFSFPLMLSSLLQLLFIIPYSVLGLAFSLNYVKTKNIASNIFLHCSWNTIALILATLSTI